MARAYTLIRVRRLIINADDFGLTTGVNRAILECHAAGIVTSTTLMANAAATAAAAALAKSHSRLGVGCHVVLVDGAPLTPAASLLAARTGRFEGSIAAFARRALGKSLRADEIAAEALAQFRHLQGAGLALTHFDTHKHTHMFPTVLRALLQAAREAGIRALRNPFVPVKALAWAHLVRRPKLWVRYSQVNLLRRFAEQFHCEVKAAGLRTTHGSFGVIATGALDQPLFDAIAGSIPEGAWEFVCHPGYHDAELDQVPTRLRAARDEERRVLTSAATQAALRRHGIDLIHFGDL